MVFSQEMPRSSFNVELDAACATWLANDVAMLSSKTGELLLLTLVYDGRSVTGFPIQWLVFDEIVGLKVFNCPLYIED